MTLVVPIPVSQLMVLTVMSTSVHLPPARADNFASRRVSNYAQANVTLPDASLREQFAWVPLHKKLVRWVQLSDDWDGSGAIAPNRTAIDAARTFLEAAQEGGTPMPTPYISADGEIGYRWEKDGGYASVAFFNDGNMVAYIRRRNEAVPLVDIDVPIQPIANFPLIIQGLREFT